MNAFISHFAPALAVVFAPVAALGQAMALDSMPDIFISDHIDYYKSTEPTWEPPANDTPGHKTSPDFTPLPGGDPGSDEVAASTFEYKSTLPLTAAFGPANFLTKVADSRGRSFGSLKLNVSAGRAYTGVLRLGKKTYRFRGTLDGNGAATQVLTRRSTKSVALAVQVTDGLLSAVVWKGNVTLSAQ